MIKKFSIIVFLFVFSAQSETLYPTGRKKEVACAAQLGGDRQRLRIRIKNDKEKDKIFVKDCETHTGDLSGTIKNHRIAPSNTPKNPTPTDRAQSKRKKNQASRAFLDKRRIKREELIKKIEDFLGTDPEMTKPQLCKKLKLSMVNFWYFLENLQKETPKIFQQLNVKYPKIFFLKKQTKKDEKEYIFEKIKKVIIENQKITILHLCKTLEIKDYSLRYWLKKLQSLSPEKFHELNSLIPGGFLDRNKKKCSNIMKKIKEILIDNREINITDLSKKLGMNRIELSNWIRKLNQKNPEEFHKLNDLSTPPLLQKIKFKIYKTRDEKKYLFKNLFEKIKKILIENRNISIFQLSEELDIRRTTLIDWLKKLRKINPQEFKKLADLSAHGLIGKQKKISTFKKVKKIHTQNPEIERDDLSDEMENPLNTLIDRPKSLRRKNPSQFDKPEDQSDDGLLEKRKKKKGNAILEDRSIKYPKMFIVNKNEKEEKEENLEIEAKSINYLNLSRDKSVQLYSFIAHNVVNQLNNDSEIDFTESEDNSVISGISKVL